MTKTIATAPFARLCDSIANKVPAPWEHPIAIGFADDDADDDYDDDDYDDDEDYDYDDDDDDYEDDYGDSEDD